MSEKYKFYDPAGMYFVTMSTVGWVDLFTRPPSSRWSESLFLGVVGGGCSCWSLTLVVVGQKVIFSCSCLSPLVVVGQKVIL